MKVIESSVELLPQGEGVKGMLKHTEKLGRIAYQSEDKITEESYQKFNENIKKRGHWAVFDSGTVYMAIPLTEKDLLKTLKSTAPYTRWTDERGYSYLTTTYRIILKKGLEKEMNLYWCEPIEGVHKKRVTFKWICSRGTAFEAVRHRVLSFIMESTRYCMYSKDKFGNELTFILPEWAKKAKRYYIEEGSSWIKDLEGGELWKALTALDRVVASHNNSWLREEADYIYETTTDEGFRLKAEEARGILGNDLKCVLGITGYVEDFYKIPDPGSPEKEGFFFLREAPDAHPDIKVLATKSREEYEKKYISKS